MKKLFLVLLFVFVATTAQALTLEWDPNPDADYYVVYWGEQSREYTGQSIKIEAPVTEYEVPSSAGRGLYFSVKAFNNYGNSSEYSDELHDTKLQTIDGLRFRINVLITVDQ